MPNKLVRDRIPELIEAEGMRPVIRILGEQELRECLERKLDEEVQEFHQDRNLEELADILEVVFALSEAMGSSQEELMMVYRRKHEQRGGFSKGIFLVEKQNPEQ